MSVKCYFSFDKLLTLDIAHRKLTKTRLLRNFNKLLFAQLNVNCVTPELHQVPTFDPLAAPAVNCLSLLELFCCVLAIPGTGGHQHHPSRSDHVPLRSLPAGEGRGTGRRQV